ncbi:MAG TPA: hypothetical protein VNR00_09500 [Opitutus sp.]|nr:hypothetical protein [Opitutus sp.]
MNMNHAFGFLFVGTVFGLLPRFAPGLCPVGLDGSSARELWLQLMSAVLIGVAVISIGQRVLSVLASMLEYDPRRVASQPELETMPVGAQAIEIAAVRPAMVRRVRPGKLIPVPVAALRTGLLEQQRAA